MLWDILTGPSRFHSKKASAVLTGAYDPFVDFAHTLLVMFTMPPGLLTACLFHCMTPPFKLYHRFPLHKTFVVVSSM
jgi:hypothetical protein